MLRNFSVFHQSIMNSNENSKPKFPFTQSQYQELETQALIFKYIISGIPIPSHLLFTIQSSLNSKINWSCFQMGCVKKFDPEPGRCRRTDGKKWRCSKEAYPDSKYCEKHMHRGKNRSRKPVEIVSAINGGNPAKLSVSSNFHHPFGSSSRFDQDTSLVLDSGLYSQTNSDFRYIYGLKEEADEHAVSGKIRSISSSSSSMEDSWQFAPLSMTCNLHLHKQDGPQKTIHHFFDEWPLKHGDSSSTNLSISIPTSDNDG